MRKRKTIEIDFIKDTINEALKNTSYPLNTDQKETLCTFLEICLYKTNNYKGFYFLNHKKTEIFTNEYYTRKYF